MLGIWVAGHSRVIALTTFDLDEYAYRALRAGASGFLRRGFLLRSVPESVAGGQHRPGRGLQLERIEQPGEELADLGEDGDQPFMERIHGTRYYG